MAELKSPWRLPPADAMTAAKRNSAGAECGRSRAFVGNCDGTVNYRCGGAALGAARKSQREVNAPDNAATPALIELPVDVVAQPISWRKKRLTVGRRERYSRTVLMPGWWLVKITAAPVGLALCVVVQVGCGRCGGASSMCRLSDRPRRQDAGRRCGGPVLTAGCLADLPWCRRMAGLPLALPNTRR